MPEFNEDMVEFLCGTRMLVGSYVGYARIRIGRLRNLSLISDSSTPGIFA